MPTLLHAGVFSVSAALSPLLTPGALRLARRAEVVDHSGGPTGEADAVPELGGLAVVTAFAGGTLAVALASPTVDVHGLLVVLGLGLAVALLGLVDDVRALPPALRLTVEAAIAVALYLAADGAESSTPVR